MATKYKKYMATLNIRNIGPIKEVWLELKRYNFFIGPQSSGKSTIAKIISNCLWMEKEIAVHPNKHNDMQYYESIFISQLENFHNMHGYFDNQSAFLSYESDYVKIVFENKFYYCADSFIGQDSFKTDCSQEPFTVQLVCHK